MKFYVILTIAVLGIGLVAGTASAQDEINYTEMVEDLKVMCQIIDETMDEIFENDYVKGGFFRRGGCQHLYLKGYGPMFLLDVRFPVTENEMKIVKTEKKTNLWEKHERAVRHQGQPEEAVWVVGKNESYSKEKVDKLKEQLAYLVGEYGSRIGQLGFDDTISFVVFGYPDYTIDLETDFLDFEWRVVDHIEDAMLHPRETIEDMRKKIHELKEKQQLLEEAKRELEGTAEQKSQNNNKKIINPQDETIIVEKEIDEEMEDSQPQNGKRFRKFILRVPKPLVPPLPTPLAVPSLSHGFHGKPATTLILTFKRSQLEGKNGTDWEALLKTAEVVEY